MTERHLNYGRFVLFSLFFLSFVMNWKSFRKQRSIWELKSKLVSWSSNDIFDFAWLFVVIKCDGMQKNKNDFCSLRRFFLIWAQKRSEFSQFISNGIHFVWSWYVCVCMCRIDNQTDLNGVIISYLFLISSECMNKCVRIQKKKSLENDAFIWCDYLWFFNCLSMSEIVIIFSVYTVVFAENCDNDALNECVFFRVYFL